MHAVAAQNDKGFIWQWQQGGIWKEKIITKPIIYTNLHQYKGRFRYCCCPTYIYKYATSNATAKQIKLQEFCPKRSPKSGSNYYQCKNWQKLLIFLKLRWLSQSFIAQKVFRKTIWNLLCFFKGQEQQCMKLLRNRCICLHLSHLPVF